MELSCALQNDTQRERVPPLRSFPLVAVRHLHIRIACFQEDTMPRGDKSKYTDKEKRQAEHIEEGYEERGVPTDEAERRAWATVNKVHGGGEKPGGGGYGKPENHEPMRKGGRNSHKK
jgi:plasmid stabilization system protein ParE